MTRTKNRSAAAELGGSLATLRLRRGDPPPSYRTIERALVITLGQDAPTNEWIRLAHTGAVDPETSNLAWFAGLADYYEVDLDELHPTITSRSAVFARVLSLSHPLDRSRGAEKRRPALKSVTPSLPGVGTHREHRDRKAVRPSFCPRRERREHYAWAA